MQAQDTLADFRSQSVDLTPDDLANLARFRISSEALQAASVRRVTGEQARRLPLINKEFPGKLDGVVFPNLDPRTYEMRGWALRRDQPEFDEKGRQKRKYLYPRGRSLFYFPVSSREWLRDTSVPVIFVESIKAAIALMELANRVRRRWLVIALGGCWNWRAEIGKEAGANGTRAKITGPNPDLDLIALGNRRAVVCFDSNRATKDNVREAEGGFTRELLSMKATAEWIGLPDVTGINGPDDAIAILDDEAVLSLIDRSKPRELSDSVVISFAIGGPVKTLADAIQRTELFAKDQGGRLHHFKDGVYKPRGEEIVFACTKRLLEESKLSSKWSSHRASEVAEYIRVDAQTLWERPPLDVVNVTNGLLQVESRELLKHSPDHLSPVQLPVGYDPEAVCLCWDQFVEEVFPEDSRCLAWEIPGCLMIPETSIQKAVLLLGMGGNGRSTYLAGLYAFLGGSNNVSTLSLHKIDQSIRCG
jgi:hypothetical protein